LNNKSFLLLFFKKDVLPSSRSLRFFLLALTALRLIVAARAPLSADESYYWIWSKALAPGYLDHPPMVALWIRAGTLVAGDTPLGVRLLGPVSALLGTLLLMRAGEDFWPGRNAGVVAAVLLNATLAMNVGAVIMTPDTPLLFFWTASLAALGRLVRSGRAGWWLVFGLAAGCALDSKYTGALLGASVIVWVGVIPQARRWVRCREFWWGGLVAAAVFAPVVGWNADHGWASFAKQGGRAGDWRPAEAVRFVSELMAGQVGLATPWVALMFAAGMRFVARGFWRRDDRGEAALLASLTLLPAAVFLEHALGGRVQANWPAVMFPGAALAAAGMSLRWWRAAAAMGFLVSGAVFLQAAAAPLALPRGVDFTLIRLGGWADVAGRVFVAQAREHASFVVADEYGLASELAFRLHGPVMGVGRRWRYFALPPADLAGRIGLLVRSARADGEPDKRVWASAVSVGDIVRSRNGVVAETYRMYRVQAAAGGAAVCLPNPQTVSGKLASD